MTKCKSNAWRWVGVFILLLILLLLWLNGHGPDFARTSANCCGKSEQIVDTPAVVPITESVPEVTLQEAPVPPTEPEPSPAPQMLDVPACSADMNVAVEFDKGSAVVSDLGKQQLDIVAKCLTEKTQVIGFTDNTGSPKTNLTLSLLRAQAVVDYMVSQNPTMTDLLTATGHGADDPIADNSTPEGRAKNRRIQFLKK